MYYTGMTSMYYTGMNKSIIKEIRAIARRLPVVKEAHMSGYTQEGKPNIYTVAINHERRMRKAVEAHGEDGLIRYLEWIGSLQKKRLDEVNSKKGEAVQGSSGDAVVHDNGKEKPKEDRS